ncbi:hypothetical protein [Aliidongia dinghuensis]|uniref:hypothetical protein n=1 Tax=Aliidongia dinghuensis TaxID=1867774 RepID=UPI001666323D|nr:hypothetical protein [Aliidongia dinghuensis]
MMKGAFIRSVEFCQNDLAVRISNGILRGISLGALLLKRQYHGTAMDPFHGIGAARG